MSWLVDTSVWSLALRRDSGLQDHPETVALKEALLGTDPVYTTGLILQELLQGFSGPKNRRELLKRFDSILSIAPDRSDHIEAADLLFLAILALPFRTNCEIVGIYKIFF